MSGTIYRGDLMAGTGLAPDKKRIKELEAELAALKEAADKYSGWGHHEICQAIPDYNIKCVCGLAELEALITPSDTKPGLAPESSQEAPEKT